MKKESCIYIDKVLFRSFTVEESKNSCGESSEFVFDRQSDFLFDASFGGIAVRIDFCNERYVRNKGRGVRRKVSLTLVDTTARSEITSRKVTVRMSRTEYLKSSYAVFSLSQIAFRAGHNYKLVVCDETASENLGEYSFHIFSQDTLGDPADWYDVYSAGIRREGEYHICRSVDSTDSEIFVVRFKMRRNLSGNLPAVLPEIEMRIYYPECERIETHFMEPSCVDFAGNRYMVESSFMSESKCRGAYYAEILCMKYPLAGFVFGTSGPELNGDWRGDDIMPLEEYSPEAADTRYDSLLGGEKNDDEESFDFDAALDRFIKDEMSGHQDSEVPESGGEAGDMPDDSGSSVQEKYCEAESGISSTSLLPSLDHLTGLRSVKDKLMVYERIVRFNKLRSDNNLPTTPMPLHAMFLGSPGTGKTTVAKMMGVILHKAGILSKGHVVVRERATLLGQNYNSEAEKTLAAIEEAQGGILLIDEAYQLYQPEDARDPGKFVIETLLTALSDESRRDWMLVLAGYPDEMRKMADMNPGFKSRIPDSNVYMFDDFSEDELMEIADNYISRLCYELSPEAREALVSRLRFDCSHRGRNFGNARHIINLIQTEILPAMAVRVITAGVSGPDSLTVIRESDIPRAIERGDAFRRRIGFAV